ncbi:MAG: DUF4260 domain-containing protein [Cyclobacteriaceae bacterium]|nr:DUF4260 domain-containing protein [Cyclobacteriaceae bacterium SS2]
MKISLQIEELTQFIASIVVLVYLDAGISWWLWPILFLAPDIGMLGYLANPKIGSWSYNFFHFKSIALAVVAYGYFFDSLAMLIAGVVLFGHAAMDRMFGFGLKYPDNFKHTHLGMMN